MPLSRSIPSEQWVPMPPSNWTPDDASDSCQNCNRPFTVINRRHHCRWCGRLFCNQCTSNSREWYGIGLRCCADCHDDSNGKLAGPDVLVVCPVCSKFLGCNDDLRESHLQECLKNSLSIQGNRYHSSILDHCSPSECEICLVSFEKGDHLAVLNCLCKFHEHCIQDWFDRGHCCPYHP